MRALIDRLLELLRSVKSTKQKRGDRTKDKYKYFRFRWSEDGIGRTVMRMKQESNKDDVDLHNWTEGKEPAHCPPIPHTHTAWPMSKP